MQKERTRKNGKVKNKQSEKDKFKKEERMKKEFFIALISQLISIDLHESPNRYTVTNRGLLDLVEERSNRKEQKNS